MKYFFFGIINFAYGIEFSIMLVILPIYLVENGFSINVATLVIGIGTLPWMIKFFWGGIVDFYIRYGRKFFVFIGGILGGIGFIIAGIVDPVVSLLPFVVIILLAHIGTAISDVSLDALVIDISTMKDRGKINGVMRYSNYFGTAIGIGGFGFIAEDFNYGLVFIITGFLLVIVVFTTFVVNEGKLHKKYQSIFPLLIKEFKKKTTQLVTVFAPISNINAGIITVIVPLYLKAELKLDIAMIGMVSMILPITIAIGSIIGGIATDRWGRKMCLYVFIIPSIFITILFVFAVNWQIAMFLYGIIGFLIGSYSTIVSTLFMDITNPKVGATQFSILASLSNAGELGAGAITGTLIVLFGFTRSFLYAAWFIGPMLLLLYIIKIKKEFFIKNQ